MKITLKPMQDYEISARGETVVYMSGSEPLLVMAKDKRAEIPSTSQVRFPVFDRVTLKNMGEIEAEFEVFIVEGEFRSLAEGSKLISYIENTSEISTPIVLKLSEISAEIYDPIVNKISELVNVKLKTEEQSATSMVESIHIFTNDVSHTINSNGARRDIFVFADSENTGAVMVGGIPLEAGKLFNLNCYTGPVNIVASSLLDKIYITEVIK